MAASGYQDYVTTTYGNPNEIGGHGVVVMDESRGVYYFEFEGGYAPYCISAYALDFAGSGKDVLVETKYLYKDEGTTRMALPKEYPMLWTDDTIAYQPYQYYFVIKDGSGQEITFGK